MMVECTIFLKSDITEWTYSRELKLSPPSDNATLRTLCLDGELEFQGFIDRQIFRCVINCGTDSFAEANVVGCLELNEASLGEPELPVNASLELTVSEEEFNDLKDCLMRSIGHKHTHVSVRFDLQGVQQERTRKCCGKWIGNYKIKCIAGRQLEVTGFSWELDYRSSRRSNSTTRSKNRGEFRGQES